MQPVSASRRQFLAMLLAGAVGGGVRTAFAEDGDAVSILLSAEEATYRQAAEAIKAGLPRGAVRILGPSAPLTEVSGVLVALGQKAARQVVSQGYRDPVLVAMIPAAAYRGVVSGLPAEARRRWSAIVLDQPWSRQLALIRLLMPRARKVGLLVSNGSGEDLPEIRASAEARGLVLEARQVSDERQMFAELRQLLSSVDVLWALPDSLVISRSTLEGYLVSAYRARIPVIGYSRAMVEAGALAAVYTAPDDVGRDVAAVLSRGVPGAAAGSPALIYPERFSVKINNSVARSLDLPAADEDAVRHQLERKSGS